MEPSNNRILRNQPTVTQPNAQSSQQLDVTFNQSKPQKVERENLTRIQPYYSDSCRQKNISKNVRQAPVKNSEKGSSLATSVKSPIRTSTGKSTLNRTSKSKSSKASKGGDWLKIYMKASTDKLSMSSQSRRSVPGQLSNQNNTITSLNRMQLQDTLGLELGLPAISEIPNQINEDKTLSLVDSFANVEPGQIDDEYEKRLMILVDENNRQTAQPFMQKSDKILQQPKISLKKEIEKRQPVYKEVEPWDNKVRICDKGHRLTFKVMTEGDEMLACATCNVDIDGYQGLYYCGICRLEQCVKCATGGKNAQLKSMYEGSFMSPSIRKQRIRPSSPTKNDQVLSKQLKKLGISENSFRRSQDLRNSQQFVPQPGNVLDQKISKVLKLTRSQMIPVKHERGQIYRIGLNKLKFDIKGDYLLVQDGSGRWERFAQYLIQNKDAMLKFESQYWDNDKSQSAGKFSMRSGRSPNLRMNQSNLAQSMESLKFATVTPRPQSSSQFNLSPSRFKANEMARFGGQGGTLKKVRAQTMRFQNDYQYTEPREHSPVRSRFLNTSQQSKPLTDKFNYS